MMNKKAVLINASPKVTDNSASEYYISLLESYLSGEDCGIYKINVRRSLTKGSTVKDFEAMAAADALVITFPLYIFCLPGILMQYLQDYKQYLQDRPKTDKLQKIYTIINCGFPEADINEEAARVIRSFCNNINASYRFGILIGGGPSISYLINEPFMQKTKDEFYSAFTLMSKDIMNDSRERIENIEISLDFIRKEYLSSADNSWNDCSKENGLKAEDIYRRPYLA